MRNPKIPTSMRNLWIWPFLPLSDFWYSWQHTNQTPHCSQFCTPLTLSPWCSPLERRCRSLIRCTSGIGSWSGPATPLLQCQSASHTDESLIHLASYVPLTLCCNIFINMIIGINYWVYSSHFHKHASRQKISQIVTDSLKSHISL